MEEVLQYIIMYSPAAISIITVIISLLTSVKNVKNAIGDTKEVNKKVATCIQNISASDYALKEKLEQVEQSYTEAIENVIKQNMELVKNNEQLKAEVEALVNVKKELNQIKKQIALIIKE